MTTKIKILLVGIMVVPYSAFATTDCRVIEYPDHYEAVCTGDEKYDPGYASKQATTRSSPAPQNKAPEKSGPITTQEKPVPRPIVSRGGPAHRQGRQQYQQTLTELKNMRAQLIAEHQRNQPPPAYVPPPSPIEE